MEKVLEKLRKLDSNQIEPNHINLVLNTFDFANIQYMQYLADSDFDQYHRIYIMDAPMRVYLTVWPAQYQLPAHQHNDFWGYIAILKGLLTETSFVFEADDNKLSCHPPKSYRKGEVIFEPRNVIHHLQNPSPSKPLVTAHFYHPPVYNYEGVMVFDIRNRRIAELNGKAPGISLEHPDEYYNKKTDNAFSVVNLW
jgi:predicted metal-dependent enzyme (double-stranded beta helix superfamily)